jgi:hypothetical protein
LNESFDVLADEKVLEMADYVVHGSLNSDDGRQQRRIEEEGERRDAPEHP